MTTKTLNTPIVMVIWKDEGDFGFITTRTQADVDYRDANPESVGVPFDPDRVRAYGSLAEAKALAREHHAELRET
jgi:hypothetical protein